MGVVVPLSCSESAAANPPTFGGSLVGLFEPELDESSGMRAGVREMELPEDAGGTLVPPHPAMSPRVTRHERVAGVGKRILSWSPAGPFQCKPCGLAPRRFLGRQPTRCVVQRGSWCSRRTSFQCPVLPRE